MKTWIALLRGINVGGKHIVPMKTLVKAMEAKGFEHVKTYIQSGNVVFQHPEEAGKEVAELIEKQFGFRPEVFILSAAGLREAIANNPFQTDQGKTVHFFFCDREPESLDVDLLESLRAPSEQYQLIGKVFYLYAPDGIGRSKLAEKMGRAFSKVTMTARNLNTINKLAEMLIDY